MKFVLFSRLMMTAALAALGGSAVADDLDAALEAQKNKKVPHRVYSEQAILEDQNLTIPRVKTEKELALDKTLREMDARADAASPSLNQTMMRPAAPTMTVRPAENRNWLTPAMLDESAAVELPDNENSWQVDEMARQKVQQEQRVLVKEQETLDRLMREKMNTQRILPPTDQLKQYQLAPQNIGMMGDRTPSPASSSFYSPGNRSTGVQRSSFQESKTQPATLSPFSLQASRDSSSLNPNPLQQSTSAMPPASPFNQPSADFSLGSSSSEPATLSPLQMIKRSSPIHRADPFANDHMPQFKSSMWD